MNQSWLDAHLDESCAFTHKYGMHGGSTSASAALYALKEEELSISVQYSSNPWGRRFGDVY